MAIHNFFLVMSCGIPALASLMITITKNDIQAEIMCCIFEGFTTLTEPIIFCIMVELFPSNVRYVIYTLLSYLKNKIVHNIFFLLLSRGVAFSMVVMMGRLGAVFGVFIFGELIDSNCEMIFYLLAIFLFSELNYLNIILVNFETFISTILL